MHIQEPEPEQRQAGSRVSGDIPSFRFNLTMEGVQHSFLHDLLCGLSE